MKSVFQLIVLFLLPISILLITGCESKVRTPGDGDGRNSANLGTVSPAASASDILLGKKAYDSNGNIITGTIALPTNSQICQTENILGVQGNRICQSESATSPASPSDVLFGQEYWDSTGRKQIGVGNFDWNTQIYSMAPRKDTATQTPSTSTPRNVATLSQEVSNATAFQDHHNLIPDPKFDTDGRFSNVSGAAERHYLVTITGRPSTTCGITGTLEERISDCSSKNGIKAFYDGKKYGQSGEGDWKLVTRTSDSYEVWRDERTKLLWSDRMSTTYNWYQASGYASTDSNTNNTGGYDARPGKGTGCSGSACQSNPPVSLCVDASLISTLSGYNAFTTPAEEDSRKGNLTSASTPSVTWRLPTIDDWKLADVNGIRKVLPNMDYVFWSSSSSSFYVGVAWIFYGANGFTGDNSRGYDVSVRCVGH